MKAIQENSGTRVWNTDLGDILPHAVAHLLERNVIVHNYDGKKIKEILIPVTSCILGPAIHLFRSNCHYEILLNNTVTPNKNICSIPDIYEIELSTFDEECESQEEDQEEGQEEDKEEDQDGDVEYYISETDTTECMIRI